MTNTDMHPDDCDCKDCHPPDCECETCELTNMETPQARPGG